MTPDYSLSPMPAQYGNFNGISAPQLGGSNYLDSISGFGGQSQLIPSVALLGSGPTASATPAGNPNMMQRFNSWLQDSGALSKIDTQTGVKTDGWGNLAVGTGLGLMNAFMGMKQYGLAKKQFDFQRDAFERNYGAQRQSINTQLEDRQRARVASNPGAYQSVGEYMNRNSIK